MVLTGINIRSGLELDIPVSDIFKVNIAPDGNIIAKNFHESPDKKNKALSQEIKKILNNDQFIAYNDIKISNKLNESLTCYVYDSYFIYQDEKKNNKIVSEKNVELLFVNSEKLNLEDFCKNFMLAQSYSGNFSKPEFNYPFIGVGDFDFDNYIDLHGLCVYSSLNLVNFFVYHKKILSSIGYFMCGLFENDIREQRKYITEQEYKQLLNLVKKHKRNILNTFKDISDENNNLSF